MNYLRHPNDCFGFCKSCPQSVYNNQKAHRNIVRFDLCGIAIGGIRLKGQDHKGQATPSLMFIGRMRRDVPRLKEKK